MAGVTFKQIFSKGETEAGRLTAPETILASGAKLIQSELQFLLETERYSMFFGNGIGADLDKYTYLMNNRATYNLIRDELEKLFAKYKKAYLQKITMNFNNAEKRLYININVSTDRAGENAIMIPLTLGG